MQSSITAGLLLCAALVAALPDNWENTFKTYRGYRVYEVVPKSRDQVTLLRKWMIEEIHFDFWKEPAKNLEPVHIMVNARQAARLTTKLRKHGMDFSIYKENIDRDIEEFVSKEVRRRSSSQKAFDINDFNTYEDITDWIENDMMAQCTSNGLTCTIDNQYKSYEGLDIPVVTISSGGTGKTVYLIDATIHAREWLAPATVLKMMNHLSNDDEDSAILENNDFVFVPIYNPDGYVYSWTNERMWRKNRGDNAGSICVGIDLNRNCDYMFGEEGVSTNPCSDLYSGETGNSEPETVAIADILGRYADRQKAYITFHSYGKMWMHPWGNTVNNAGAMCERAADHADMFAVADATADAIEEACGGGFDCTWARGTSCEVIYETTGATDDYAKAIHGWKYPFTPELRGNNFIINADQIEPSFQEVWAGILAKEDAINTNGVF